MLKSLLLLLLMVGSHARRDGPPVGGQYPNLCSNMMPEHDSNVAQSGVGPFTIVPSQTCYKAGDKLSVELKATTSTSFKGFFIQARVGASTSASYGMFEAGDGNQKTLDCFSNTANAIGHSNSDLKMTTTFYWSPETTTSDVTFTYTVVEYKAKFWVQQMSSVVMYNSSCVETTTSNNTYTGDASRNTSNGKYLMLMFAIGVAVLMSV